MINFTQLQTDFAHALRGDDWLRNVNIVTRHDLNNPDTLKLLPDKTLAAEVLCYITPRNGRKGCGVIVEVPEVGVASGNLPGPEFDLALTCLILEDPVTNLAPQTGTLKPADQVAQRILEVGHGWRIEPHGEFFARGPSLREAADFEPLRAFRCQLNLKLPRTQTTRTALNQNSISEASGEITLTVPEGAEIYYTTDGTFPGPGNPAATIYSGVFTATAGTVIRWAAYKVDELPSFAGYATVT
jgi:hypothetical protein